MSTLKAYTVRADTYERTHGVVAAYSRGQARMMVAKWLDLRGWTLVETMRLFSPCAWREPSRDAEAQTLGATGWLVPMHVRPEDADDRPRAGERMDNDGDLPF